MPKHTNVVRFRVKSGKQAEFESLFSKADNWDGQLLHILARSWALALGLGILGFSDWALTVEQRTAVIRGMGGFAPPFRSSTYIYNRNAYYIYIYIYIYIKIKHVYKIRWASGQRRVR